MHAYSWSGQRGTQKIFISVRYRNPGVQPKLVIFFLQHTTFDDRQEYTPTLRALGFLHAL